MKYKLLGLLLLAGLLLPAATWAGTNVSAAWEFTSPGTEFTDGSWTNGEVFIPNVNFSVGYLGYYDPSTGMNGSHAVGLFDASGNLLAETVVTGASAYSSPHFLYNAISPVALIAGDTYVVEGVSDIDDYAWNDPGFYVNPLITALGQNANGYYEGLVFNGTTVVDLGVTDGFWGPDFAPTPEPSSFLLLGSGLAALAGLVRRKMRI